jgi:hypothetical protein
MRVGEKEMQFVLRHPVEVLNDAFDDRVGVLRNLDHLCPPPASRRSE